MLESPNILHSYLSSEYTFLGLHLRYFVLKIILRYAGQLTDFPFQYFGVPMENGIDYRICCFKRYFTINYCKMVVFWVMMDFYLWRYSLMCSASLMYLHAVQPVDVFACFYRLCSLFTTIKGSKGLKELIFSISGQK